MTFNMTNNIVMLKVNVHEAKTHLSRYLEAVANGETVIICNRNVPIAELRALPAEASGPRPIGLARGSFEVAESFFDPLPDEVVRAFEGGA
jgi:antitoxin (DNA-binding transcriptional repressor) of toxin-antitoxin stability system